MKNKAFKYVHFMTKISEVDTDYKLPMSCYKKNRSIQVGETAEDFISGLKTIIVSEIMSVGRQKYLARVGFFNK